MIHQSSPAVVDEVQRNELSMSSENKDQEDEKPFSEYALFRCEERETMTRALVQLRKHD